MHADIAGAFSNKLYSSSFQLPFHSTCTCVYVHMSIDSYKSKVIFLRGKEIEFPGEQNMVVVLLLNLAESKTHNLQLSVCQVR